MITGVHGLIYTEDADGVRAFFRDVLGFDHVDTGDGWLIFALPPAELGVHPSGPGVATGGVHELWLMCDDIEATVASLEDKGVEFAKRPYDAGFGVAAQFRIPGNGTLNVYQPRHATAVDPRSPG